MRINLFISTFRVNTISLLALLGITFALLHSENTIAQSVVISGRVIDSTSNVKLAYATIAIFNSSDSLIGGSLSDEQGKFKITTNRQIAKKIAIRYTGYSTKNFAISNLLGDNIKLGNVNLKPEINLLGSIEIKADVAQIERKFEKIIIRPAKSTISAAINIYEILRTIPGIAVDESNNIRYRGFSPTVYINNTPAFILYPNMESIPPNMIEKVELIDAGMRIGGEGKGGIVNIILKKQKREGISGMVSTKPSTTRFEKVDNFSNFLNLNYKQKIIIS